MKLKIYDLIALIIVEIAVINYAINGIWEYNFINKFVALFVESYIVTYAFVLFFINLFIMVAFLFVLFFIIKNIKN